MSLIRIEILENVKIDIALVRVQAIEELSALLGEALSMNAHRCLHSIHRDRAEDDRGRSDVASIRRLLKFRHSSIEIGIGPGQFAFLHQPDLVIRRAGHLIFDAPCSERDG